MPYQVDIQLRVWLASTEGRQRMVQSDGWTGVSSVFTAAEKYKCMLCDSVSDRNTFVHL